MWSHFGECFPVNLLNIFRTPFYKKTLRGLLLIIDTFNFLFMKFLLFVNRYCKNKKTKPFSNWSSYAETDLKSLLNLRFSLFNIARKISILFFARALEKPGNLYIDLDEHLYLPKSCDRRCFVKKVCFQESLLNKVGSFQACNFLKKRL